MAGLNGMGPQNAGPMTGRGLGPCGGGMRRGMGMGAGGGRCGGGYGRGGGRGYRNRFVAGTTATADEPAALQQQIDALQRRLDAARATTHVTESQGQ